MTKATSVNVPSEGLHGLDGEVRFKHLRVHGIDVDTMQEFIYNHGGVSIAYRFLTSEELTSLIGTDQFPAIIVGFAGCSIEDNFDRKLGREIAKYRLAKSQIVLIGEDQIKRLVTANDPYQVRDVLTAPMFAQGIRLEACI